MALFNSFFIPTIVYQISELLFLETKQDKDKSKMRKYFFYLLMISFILPLVNQTEILSIFTMITDKGINTIQDKMNRNLIEKNSLFLRYVVTCTFIS